MVKYIKYTPEVANDWKQTIADVSKDYPYLFKRVLDCSTSSQLQSKLWAINEIRNLIEDAIIFFPKNIAILGGWYANYITELLVSNIRQKFIQNFEIDEDTKNISYKFNKRFKDRELYKCDIRDIMWEPIDGVQYQLIINTSCEHMFPMTRFYSLNKFKIPPVYVLQSTDDSEWDDHINCVSSAEELIEQSKITEVLYSGEQKLDNGMKRFMVIGYPAEEGYRIDEATDSRLV